MICKQCGIEFTEYLDEGLNKKKAHHNLKFCCDKCRDEHRRARKRATQAKLRAKRGPRCSPSMMPRPCVLCGEVFKPNSANQKVCESVECRRAINGKVTEDTDAICSICGATFVLKAGSVRATCSPECHGEASSRAQIGRAQKGRDEDRPKPESFNCPFAAGQMKSGVSECPDYSCAQVDPFGRYEDFQPAPPKGEAMERRAA